MARTSASFGDTVRRRRGPSVPVRDALINTVRPQDLTPAAAPAPAAPASTGVSGAAGRADILAKAQAEIERIGTTGNPDLDAILQRLQPRQEEQGLGQRILRRVGRAAEGFASGVAATPRGAGFDPVRGGVVGGLAGIGRQRAREEARGARLESPRRKLLSAITQAQAEEAIKAPGRTRAKKQQAVKETAQKEIAANIRRETLATIAKITARNAGVSDAIAKESRNQAVSRVLTRPNAPLINTPEFDAAVVDESIRIANEFKRVGAKGARGAPTAPARGQPQGPDPLGNILFR